MTPSAPLRDPLRTAVDHSLSVLFPEHQPLE